MGGINVDSVPVVVAGGEGQRLRENRNGERGLGHRRLLSVKVSRHRLVKLRASDHRRQSHWRSSKNSG
ncbi:hypothetical protein Acr_00g0091870 [Actinidia rufa]|uniref:Uncharacterized protein n=1 Tax=Actinidia rufa TaxID=165716 RepID=A0A7J0DXY7_9ERIC|nr:hypothetical protein Acr_00g0091870 [Actinidia rufa]